MNEFEAYRRFNAERRRDEKWRRVLRRIAEDIECIRTWQDSALVWLLTEREEYRRVLVRFTGRTQYGWECAAHPDGKVARLPRILGWDRFSRAVREAKSILGI